MASKPAAVKPPSESDGSDGTPRRPAPPTTSWTNTTMSTHEPSWAAPPLRWVSTGRSAAVDFAAARATALALVPQRNKLLDASQQAYRSGDGARAAALGREAQEVGARLAEAQREAAQELVRARNPEWCAQRASGRIPDPFVLDLHTLYVAEAVELLAAELPAVREMVGIGRGSGMNPSRAVLQLIVGLGKHREGKHSEGLNAGVKRFLSEVGVAWQEGTPGTISVDLSR